MTDTPEAKIAADECTCPWIDVSTPGLRPEFVKGLDWQCPACTEVVEQSANRMVRDLKPSIDGAARYRMYPNAPRPPADTSWITMESSAGWNWRYTVIAIVLAVVVVSPLIATVIIYV